MIEYLRLREVLKRVLCSVTPQHRIISDAPARSEKLKPWLDIWNLVPGDPWQESREQALDASRTCAVFLLKVSARGSNRRMAERGLYEMNRRAPIKAMGGMGVA